MPKIEYIPTRFQSRSLAIIAQADAILNEYAAQGFSLTLRQLYYQFVARGFIPNRQFEYNKLGNTINDARLAGLIDWNHIEDRGRWLRSVPHWNTPSSIIESAASSYRVDKWEHQHTRIEVWIEKDALIGVIEGVCESNDVSYFSCRGYNSQSEMWRASMRYVRYLKAGQNVRILHLGDHDPSGIDMSRDIAQRVLTFVANHEYLSYDRVKLDRLALNMDQVQTYNPPPNPAKMTDSRYAGYIAEYGSESWELDALEPRAISDLIQDAIDNLRDRDRWETDVARENSQRDQLRYVSDRWDSVVEFIEDGSA